MIPVPGTSIPYDQMAKTVSQLRVATTLNKPGVLAYCEVKVCPTLLPTTCCFQGWENPFGFILKGNKRGGFYSWAVPTKSTHEAAQLPVHTTEQGARSGGPACCSHRRAERCPHLLALRSSCRRNGRILLPGPDHGLQRQLLHLRAGDRQTLIAATLPHRNAVCLRHRQQPRPRSRASALTARGTDAP